MPLARVDHEGELLESDGRNSRDKVGVLGFIKSAMTLRP